MKFELKSNRFTDSVYYKSGKGKALILLHGFAEDHRIWKNQIAFLQHQFLVIAPDLPGSGSSSLPSEKMSMELLAEFVLEIIEQEKLQEIILIGHSMGGYTALAFAERFESKINGLSLIHSTAYEDDETKKENRRKSIKLIHNNGKEIFLKTMIPNLYSSVSQKNCSAEMAFHLKMAMQFSNASLESYYQAMIDRPSRVKVLKHAHIPFQFVIGTEDNAVPLQQSLSQCFLPEISKTDLLTDIGHTSMMECPDKLNAMLNSFCKYAFER
jgi:pimeloyl-ACP methyl ester carboxylesterase